VAQAAARMLAIPSPTSAMRAARLSGKVSENNTDDLLKPRAWVDEGLIRPVIEARLPSLRAPR
jgi:hypothetical protein